ncbi:SNF2-related protein [Hydrogenophaga sp.]|uniref:SNF2-related protein n=1 Tax=Hydrogenophaga sp. TaxID=1904254 RepID=UPI002FC9C9E9
MSLFDLFRRLGSGSSTPAVLSRKWTHEGLFVRFAVELAEATLDALLESTDKASPEETFFAAYLSQLVGEDRASLSVNGVLVPWGVVYDLITAQEHAGVVQAFELPRSQQLVPVLDSMDTMVEKTFEVLEVAWVGEGGPTTVSSIVGAIATLDTGEVLLPRASWELSHSIREFTKRGEDARTQHENELGWGVIRTLADHAGALYRRPYLQSTFVLTPQTLRLPLSKEDTPFGRVLTVEPTFEGAPQGWVKAFDGFTSVQAHYDFSSPGTGFTRVVISEPVRKVLEVIKREMPTRRVAGSKAERFIHNPWSFLGESAHEVIKEHEFAQDKACAGALATAFSVRPRIHEARIDHVDLVVTQHFHEGASSTEVTPFEGPDALASFLGQLERTLRDDRMQFPWNEYDLTIDGESPVQLEHGRQVEHLWRTQPAVKISFEDIYELEGYSGRIEGIGVAKPIYVPLLQKPSTDDEGKPGWMPGDLTPMVKVTLAGHEGQVVLPLSKEWVNEFEGQVKEAEASGAKEVINASLPTPVETPQARTLVDSFLSMLDAQKKVKEQGSSNKKEPKNRKETLLVKLNFFAVDYVEERRLSLALPSGAQPEIPASLRPSIGLKKHQQNGIAWFQHLVSRAPSDCRGALLADDMGLGKTLQLLAVLAWYYEKNPHASPSIILAPKSLVENWAAETRKFFDDSFPELLVLYGDSLKARKQPLGLIDEQLHTKGVVDLLRPGWAGDAKVIVTTYEVLTSYEFSLARHPFAFVICDEAQRIKTPGTHVTLAAKALKADFRIACTGTPVENTLADLWCLFDFVQPGLLGGLEEFGRTYRRPIECETDEQKSALDLLQNTIAPQTLRRTKLDIASELPKKFFGYRAASSDAVSFKERLSDTERLEVRMSAHQNLLYLGGLKKLQDAGSENDARKRARLSFGALHLMKAVCAEPYCLPGMKFMPDKAGIDSHYVNSPKLKWLLKELERVRTAGEKAIVFTELREVQAALYYFLREEFGLKPSIINGDSQNRQSIIERFSATKGFNVIILSTLAAGAGLNVTAANHVFHFTRPWNPAKENQATDRAYRIGQDRDVFVYCPVIVSDSYATFDVRLDEMLLRKAGLADSTLGGSGMESMLNGAGRDISFTELVSSSTEGAAVSKRYLTMDDVDRMDGYRFEVLCQMLWTRAGFTAQLTPKAKGDGGIDVIALKGREGELLQCKSSVNPEVGWDAIKEVTAGAARYQRQFAGTRFRKVAVTNQRFNRGAREQAEANAVRLFERLDLEDLLGRHPLHNHEFEDEVSEATFVLNPA